MDTVQELPSITKFGANVINVQNIRHGFISINSKIFYVTYVQYENIINGELREFQLKE